MPKGKSRQATGQTRRKLLEAAIEIVQRDTLAGLTTKRVAAAVGVSQPAFYRHFTSLDALLDAVVREVGARLVAIQTASQDQLRTIGPADPVALQTHFCGLLERALEYRPFFELYLRNRLSDDRLGAQLRRVEAEAIDATEQHLVAVLPGPSPAIRPLACAIHRAVLGAQELVLFEHTPIESAAALCRGQVMGAVSVLPFLKETE